MRLGDGTGLERLGDGTGLERLGDGTGLGRPLGRGLDFTGG